MSSNTTADSTLGHSAYNSTPESVKRVPVKPESMFFLRAETGEILQCPAESVATVTQEIALLDKLLDDLLRTQWASQQAIEQLQQAQKTMDAGAVAQAQSAADQALRKENTAREAMFKEFKDLPKANDGGAGLLEILPLATTNRQGQQQSMLRTRRITYVRSDKVKGHIRNYYNLPGDAAKLKSFYSPAEDGRYRLDSKKLAEALRTVPAKANLVKTEDVTLWAAGWAPEFAEAFNTEYDPEAAKKRADKATPDDACVQFSGGATLLRFFAGAGGGAAVDVSVASFKKLLQGRGEVSAKLSGSSRAGIELASARIDPKLYLPAKHGLQLVLPAGKNAKGGRQELNLGYARLLIEAEAGVSCGASAIAQGGLEFKLKADMTAGVRGAPAARSAAALAKPKAAADNGKLEATANVTGELSAFAGAEAFAGVNGALQWQRAELLEFKNFAKIDAKGRAQAGAGGTAMFDIGYEDRKFRLKMKLGACVGLGLKGEIAAEVGVVEIIEFDLWFKHQVVNALDQNLQYFRKEAFEAFVLMKALAIAEGKRLADYLVMQAADLKEAWEELVKTASEETLKLIKQSGDYVLTSVAEAKALLLGLLEQMKQNLKDRLDEIEQVSRWLFSATQTTQEADNVFQRVDTKFGTRTDKSSGRQRVAALIGEGELDGLIALMKSEPTPGYHLAFVDDPRYDFAKGNGTHIAWQRSAMGKTNSHLA
jgi:hypothetical protein